MYERRLKIFFGLLIAVTVVLLLRAAQVQVWSAAEYRKKAADVLSRRQLLETTRGSIVDCQGRELAIDEPCMVAAVDYRAIQRDPAWLREQALARLLARPDRAYRRADKPQRAALFKEELKRLNGDLDEMWRTLAEVSGKTLEEIEQIKADIQRRVLMRQRWIWYKKYEIAVKRHEDHEPEPWLVDWLLGGQAGPQIDSFATEVSEQTEAHTVLNNLSTDVHNRLKKQLERFPGLVLQPSKHRIYVQPYAPALCHVLGRLAPVDAGDLKGDPNPKDELRRYYFNDLIGRGGVEALCDPILRGVRGQIVRQAGDSRVVATVDPIIGKNVRLTIDAEMQVEIAQAFHSVKFHYDDGSEGAHEMHGAAVVMDVSTGAVRALVSYPTFDPNRFDELFAAMSRDRINYPMLNRATQATLEPGSTVKPIVGIGAITDGLVRIDEGIECTGYLVLHGRRWTNGRCWTASKKGALWGDDLVPHHKIPTDDPHPTGHLIFTDAIQRSCNVYFENLGDRLGLEGLSKWYRAFGLGRRTGIGIPESAGRVPDSFDGPPALEQRVACFSAIGQAQVAATPLQMANATATIARNGVWLRPTLLADASDARPGDLGPQRVDLKVSSAAVAAARQGMINVVNSRAGTGRHLEDPRVLVAGKTGTAQAALLSLATRYDGKGRATADETGHIRWITLPFSQRNDVNSPTRWYRASGTDGKPHHGWLVGFAPADNPQIAFAVMLEYGGGGGDAIPIVKTVLDACFKHHYLEAGK
jgi:penicillin-binding protein 2